MTLGQDIDTLCLCLGDISLGNLATGDLRLEKIDRTSALRRLDRHVGAKTISGLFDFGPIPDKRRVETFHAILDNLASGEDGVRVPAKSFFLETSDEDGAEGTAFPIPHNLMQVHPRQPLLIVTYYFELLPEASDQKTLALPTKLSDRMDFHWLSVRFEDR